MELLLMRKPSVDGATLGQLFVNGAFIAFTLEDVVRDGPKVPGQTAIPAGPYDVQITRSQRFGRNLPQLMNVPGFEGVRIHSGNVAADTSGCILVGLSHAHDSIASSRIALAELQPRIAGALARGEKVTIRIVNPPKDGEKTLIV